MLSQALRRAVDAIVGGERDAACAARIVREVVATEPAVELEYVEVRGPRADGASSTLDGSF